MASASDGLKAYARSAEYGSNAERAPATPTMMAMGCASCLKPLKNWMSCSCTSVCMVSSRLKLDFSSGVGSSPMRSK